LKPLSICESDNRVWKIPICNMIQQMKNNWWVSPESRDIDIWQPDILVHNIIEHGTNSRRRIMSGILWCWNLNLFICNKFSIFGPEGLESALFQNRCLAFRSPASSDLCLKLKNSAINASFQAWLGDLYTAAISTLLLLISMQTPVASVESSGGRSAWLWEIPSLTATAVLPFLPGKRPVQWKWQSWTKTLSWGLRCVSESRATSISKSCSCLLSS
jgi:hypothetical protein